MGRTCIELTPLVRLALCARSIGSVLRAVTAIASSRIEGGERCHRTASAAGYLEFEGDS